MVDAETARDTEDADRPVPPRYWWLKRILLAVGVLILALAGLRWWWGYEAERRLQAKIDEYHAAGQPVTIEDFQFPSVPDEENAAKFLMDAASALVRPAAADAFVEDLYSYPDAVAEHSDAVGRWVVANGEALRLVRAARSKNEVDWQLRFTSPVFATLFPQLGPPRNVAKFACVTALYQHHTRDDAAAVETLRDVLAQGNRLGQMRGVLIGYLVAIAIDALAINGVESITPTLRVAGADEQEQTAARPEQVRALLADLLDEEPLRESWRWAMYGERLMHLDTVTQLASGGPGAAALGWTGPVVLLSVAFRPTLQLDAILMIEHDAATIEAGAAENYPAARARMPRYPSFRSGFERGAHLVSRILLPGLERALELHFQLIAVRRMAATALAIRLYEVEHGGRPTTLEQLVPEYLSAVPIDPLAPDGRPLGYRLDAPKPLLYCLGPDGTDDGGEYALKPSGSVDMDARDLVFFLNGDRPRAPPRVLTSQPTTTQAVDEHGDEVGDEGQPDQDGEVADDDR